MLTNPACVHSLDGSLQSRLSDHKDWVRSVAWLSNDDDSSPALITGSHDGTVRLWQPEKSSVQAAIESVEQTPWIASDSDTFLRGCSPMPSALIDTSEEQDPFITGRQRLRVDWSLVCKDMKTSTVDQ